MLKYIILYLFVKVIKIKALLKLNGAYPKAAAHERINQRVDATVSHGHPVADEVETDKGVELCFRAVRY